MSQPPSDDNKLSKIFLVLMVWLGGLEKLGTLDFPPRCCIDLETRSGLLNASLGYKSADRQWHNQRHIHLETIIRTNDSNKCRYQYVLL